MPAGLSLERTAMARYEQWNSSVERALPANEPTAVRFNSSASNGNPSDSNLYTTFLFANRKMTGTAIGRVICLDEDGNWVEPSYRVFVGRNHDGDPGAQAPRGRYRGAIYTTSEFAHPIDGVSSANSHQRLRLFIEPLKPGHRITHVQLRGWSSPR
jgi:hypothetical protein